MNARAILLVALAVAGAACGGGDTRGAQPFCRFTPDPANPLLAPPWPDFILGDPSVLDPTETPDGRWHLFANTIFQGVLHYVATDGVAWERVDRLFGLGALRPYVFWTGDEYALYFEQYSSFSRSTIQVATSPDLATWSAPRTVLEPAEGFEVVGQQRVGNPFVTRDGELWRLYYSGGGILLEDSGVFEPYALGRATSTGPFGPWEREGAIELDVDARPRETLSWGSLKVLPGRGGGPMQGFANMLFRDGAVTGSAIYAIESQDGLAWRGACAEAAIEPSGAGWDAAYVYGFDPVPEGDRLLIYANARDGYAGGVERVGRYLSVPGR